MHLRHWKCLAYFPLVQVTAFDHIVLFCPRLVYVFLSSLQILWVPEKLSIPPSPYRFVFTSNALANLSQGGSLLLVLWLHCFTWSLTFITSWLYMTLCNQRGARKGLHNQGFNVLLFLWNNEWWCYITEAPSLACSPGSYVAKSDSVFFLCKFLAPNIFVTLGHLENGKVLVPFFSKSRKWFFHENRGWG